MPGRFAAGAFLLPPPRKWGRGTTLRSKVVEGASDLPFHFRRRKLDVARALSTTLRSLRSRRAVPAPAIAGGRQSPPVLAVVFFAPELCGTPLLKKRRRQPDLRQMPLAVEIAGSASLIGDGARSSGSKRSEIRDDLAAFHRRCSRVSLRSTRGYKIFSDLLPAIKGSRTPTDAVSLLHLPAKRAPWPGRARLSAFHCGSRQGDSWSPRLSVRPCFRDSPERSVLYGRSNRGAETLRVSTGVTRAETDTNPSAVSTSHAGHCAGRLMPDAARVQRGRTLCPRAPDPLPPALRHPAGVLYEERDKAAYIPCRGTLSRFVVYKATTP